MSRESDDNLSSINSTYADLYQETVKRFTRSSLSPEMDRYSPSRFSMKSTSMSQKSDGDRHASFDLYLEATGRRRSSDHGAVLTADTEQFIIGQKIWVGGIRPGQIAYIGETHFAPGDWAGIVLDEPNGKNDGCVAGKRYFQCEPKRGIFSRLTRLTLVPLSGAYTPTSPLSKNSPERSRTVSPTASMRSSFLRSPSKNGLTVGDRVIVSSGFGSRPGILRYLGETQFASGNWCGIELDEETGKNDGAVDGIRYFECKPKYGVFVPIAKVSLSPSSKKSRLSRTGSRESLNSIGTMNSIATTNTSRMRMNAQRKSTLIKPVTSPKTQFSMQDLLREKQNHIEQLMIERDLDREDAQTQALQFQKNISELQTRVVKLERELKEERKKSEDLQFSIDEVTFCGDELNAQTQVYQEKIHDLERKITELGSGTPSLQAPSVQDNLASNAAAEAANVQISELRAKLDEQSKLYKARLKVTHDEEKRLQENIKYLQTENETLQQELLEKDESLEKFSLSSSGLENLRRELVLLKEENEQERQKAQATFTQKLEEKQVEVQRLFEELASVKNTLCITEGERTNTEDECEILRGECRSRDEQLQDVNEKLAKLSAELSMQKAESATLDEMLKVQQLGSAEGQTAFEQKIVEIAKLSEQINGLQSAKTNLETELQSASKEVQRLGKMQQEFEEKLQVATGAEEEKVESMKQLESVMEELKQQVSQTSLQNAELNGQLESLKATNATALNVEENLRGELAAKDKLHASTLEQLQSSKEALSRLEQESMGRQQKSAEEVVSKTQEIEQLKAELLKQQERVRALEGESSTAVQQMSAKISELETQLKQLQEQLRLSEEALAAQQQQKAQQESVLQERLTELKSTTAALESGNSLLEKLQKEHEATLAKCRDLEEQVKQGEEKAAAQQLQLGDLMRTHEVLSTKCENLLAQNETLQQDILAARTSSSDMQGEVQKLNEAAANRQKELVQLQSSSDTERIKLESLLEEQQQKLSNADKHNTQLKEQLQKAKSEVAAKSEQLVAIEEKSVKQELALSDVLRQQEHLQAKYDALAVQNESLQQDLTVLRTTSTDSSVELVKLSQDVVARQKAYEQLMDKTSGERATLENQLQASQQRVDALCSQVELLTQELKISTEENLKRCDQLKQTEEQLGKQALELGDLGRKLETLSAKCDSLESQNASLQKDLTAQHTSATDVNAEVLKLTEELTSKQKTLQEHTDKSCAERLQLESQLQDFTQRLQTSQAEGESLRNELGSVHAAKAIQAAEFERLTAELQTNAGRQLEEEKNEQSAVRQKLVESFEAQLKSAEQTKSTLDEAISSLQNQIRLLQDELLKSQLAFKSKEEELSQQLSSYGVEKEQLRSSLQQLQNDGTATLSSVQQEKLELLQRVERMSVELQEKEQKLQHATSEAQQLQLMQTNSQTDLAKLQGELSQLQTALELSTTELAHKTKIATEDGAKVEELKHLLDAVQASNANISATNAELAAALELLEQEKCETAHIFELFEMESDQNAEQLIEKLSSMKQQLADAQAQLHSKETVWAAAQESLQSLSAELQAAQSALQETQARDLEHVTKLSELSEGNAELRKLVAEQETQLALQQELEQQLAEYKQMFNEMDDASTEKTSKMSQLEERMRLLEQERHTAKEAQKALQHERTSLQRKLELMDLEKTREIVTLQARVNDLQAIGKLKQNGSGDAGAEREGLDSEDSTAQINFLNSIIADMQKKNETLKAKIEALEALPTDFTKPEAFEIFAKRKPAPRMFCDICDEFDKHETEDCPVQASSDREYSPPPSAATSEANNNNNDPSGKKERKLPAPRKYCETCEVFGHETGECDDECF